MKIKQGHIAVATCGASGMGRELCLALARAGCDVAFCDVNREPMDETLEMLCAEAPKGASSARSQKCFSFGLKSRTRIIFKNYDLMYVHTHMC